MCSNQGRKDTLFFGISSSKLSFFAQFNLCCKSCAKINAVSVDDEFLIVATVSRGKADHIEPFGQSVCVDALLPCLEPACADNLSQSVADADETLFRWVAEVDGLLVGVVEKM